MRIRIFGVFLTSMLFCSCGEDASPGEVRSFRMGFANSAPRLGDFDLILQTLNLWTARADAAIVNTEVPWDSLYAGVPVVDYVVRNYSGLVTFFRSKQMKLWVYVDPQNGLDRTADAVALQQLGKSIADAEVQTLYRRFVVVMDSVLRPEHLGLALETNLIRIAAPPANYQGVKKAANDVAAELIARGTTAKLSISVQVDVAWGNGSGTYVGIHQDLGDFPFLQELGLSSYPYFGLDDPSQLPVNYYSRLAEEANLSVFVSESGWTSGSVSTPTISFTSTPQLQEQYIRRQKVLLNEVNAIAWFQLPFTDIDIASLPPPVPENLGYFIYLGMVDIHLQPKPALAAWDEIFAMPLESGH